MLLEVATVQKELSLMELNVHHCLLTNVLEFQIPTGMELIVSVSQDSQPLETHATALASLWVIIVKDVPQSQTQFLPMVFVNVTMDMLTLMEHVH